MRAAVRRICDEDVMIRDRVVVKINVVVSHCVKSKWAQSISDTSFAIIWVVTAVPSLE